MPKPHSVSYTPWIDFSGLKCVQLPELLRSYEEEGTMANGDIANALVSVSVPSKDGV